MRDLVDQMGGGHGHPPREDDNAVENVKLYDCKMVLHYDTGKAVLVSDTGEESRAVWLPRSSIEIHMEGKTTDAVKKDGQHIVLPVIGITVPVWLAKDKGLI